MISDELITKNLLASNERIDDLNYKGMVLIQSGDSFRFGTDSVLLSGFVRASKNDHIIDLGAGSGVLSVLIHARTHCKVTAVEVDKLQCGRLVRSAELNGISEYLDIVNADYIKNTDSLGRGRYSCAVCNPPYFRTDCGPVSNRAGATHEECADIYSIARAASDLIKFGGKLFICFPSQRLAEAICALKQADLEVKRLRPVCSTPSKPPYLCLIEAKKGAKPGIIFDTNLIICDENGEYTAETRKIYHIDGEN